VKDHSYEERTVNEMEPALDSLVMVFILFYSVFIFSLSRLF
jgi:hypothetical protein